MEPSPPLTERPARRHALALAVVVLTVLIISRVYSPRYSTDPTREVPAPVARIDVNRAGREDLLQVPGLGPNLAEAILSHRAKSGPFPNWEGLHTVHGVGPKSLEKLKPWLAVEPLPEQPDRLAKLERKPVAELPANAGKIRAGEPKIDLNTADESAFQRLPGIGTTMANRIVAAREVKRFDSVEDLRRVKGIGAKTLESVRPFVTVE
jgi:competence protein ComEA